MTLASMTGFARTQGSSGDLQWVWEMRSVNGRGLDLRLRLPPGFEALDQPVRKRASAVFARGNVSANLQVQWVRKPVAYRINEDWLDTVQTRARSLLLGEGAAEYTSISPEGLLGLRGVIETVEESLAPALEGATHADLLVGADAAIAAMCEARAEEGRALHAILSGHLDRIETLTAAARSTAATQPAAIRARLHRAVGEVLTGAAVAEDRLAQEIALLASKSDVREELDRLSAHIVAGRGLIGKREPCGRKLEFLAQEFNREANTLCSKSQDIDLTRIGLDLKATIDQLREQVANVE